ncbi:ribonuclease R family protein [Novacetimonas pomaceti]|uniref:Ribonuclease R n=1 Tax=Novacetimonas pomaceti TaxID=2021998 RepID=A0A318Q8U2_9PROT|nr:VacB/RNase II family 3'-5' exoribonuclease [Novacetimonas pomaceti]PYD76047.1 ribonuclease R [Novacetimonas pomaceti]
MRQPRPSDAVPDMRTETPRDGTGQMPGRDAVRQFIANATGRVGKREISRAFGLGPEHRAAVRDMLRELALEGSVAPAGARRFRASDRLPESAVVQVTGTDPDGDPIARPVRWEEPGAPPVIFMHAEVRGRPALAPGERVVARLKKIGPGRYEGRTLRRIDDAPPRIVGLYRATPPDDPDAARTPARYREAGRLIPADRRARAQWSIPAGEAMDAPDNEIVMAMPLPQSGPGLHPARIVERIGPADSARTISLMCACAHDIPLAFPTRAVEDAEAARAVPPAGRTDLRDVPLVTIDGADARDFDDAIYAEPDGTGFRLLVAIADVGWYVRPGSALDREALRRGNSVYFPDRVIPMLPEALSNGWCSLRPGEDRGCLFVELHVDAGGVLTSHRFGRGLMRSAARLTYEQAQAAADGHGDSTTAALPEGMIGCLFAAWRALAAARARRGTLDLDLTERRVTLTPDGHVGTIGPRVRLDSHRVVEEFMIAANVAAARELENRHYPCLYRIHAPPSPEKLDSLRTALDTLGVRLPPAGMITASDLDAVLRQTRGSACAPLVNELILRAQNQAEYSPDPIGHFGLTLTSYAHFTSPIRRYADLVTHRALIDATGLERGGPDHGRAALGQLEEIGRAVTATERRAAAAERDAIERYAASWLSGRIGSVMTGRVTGVSRFGIFVTLDATGTTGLLPQAALPTDQWHHDEGAQSLTGRHSGLSFRLGQEIAPRLAEASPLTGALLFDLPDDAARVDAQPGRARRRRG